MYLEEEERRRKALEAAELAKKLKLASDELEKLR
jgi:hypothetical protein